MTNPRFDYVTLGHIHKHQSIHDKPPVVCAGSIRRIDFGEWREPKGYVLPRWNVGGRCGSLSN